jgi:hypothetical protein
MMEACLRAVNLHSIFNHSWRDSRKMCLRGVEDTCTVAHMLVLQIICDEAA